MELMLIEQQIKDYVFVIPDISSNEKARRVIKVLDLVTDIYNKHNEEVPVNEAYEMLYGGSDEL